MSATLKLRNPAPDARISALYGPRKVIEISPGVSTLPMHYGVDYAAKTGTPIYSSLPGVVTRVGFDNNPNYEDLGIPRWPGLRKGFLYGGGWWIFIQYGNITVRYMHFASKPNFKVGNRISAGQYLGPMGATGVATGPHLHQEVLINNRWVNPLNSVPNPFPPDSSKNWRDEEDEMKPTVHVRQDAKGGFSEGTRAHPDIGKDLKPGQSRRDGKVTIYRGWEASGDKDVVTAWARTHANGFGNGSVHSWTDRAGYVAIQEQATRLSVAVHG